MTAHVVVHEPKTSLNNPGGAEMMTKMGAPVSGLPFFAFLDGKGEMIVNSVRPADAKSKAANIGYPGDPEEIDWFLAMLAKASPGMTPLEAQAIEKWLRGHSH